MFLFVYYFFSLGDTLFQARDIFGSSAGTYDDFFWGHSCIVCVIFFWSLLKEREGEGRGAHMLLRSKRNILRVGLTVSDDE